MKQISLLFALLCSLYSFSSQINGNAYLDNSSDHSGIIVKFNPISPSAIYAETTTDTNGEYLLEVENGIYNISYEKSSYQTYFSGDFLISSNETLNDVTLDSSTVLIVNGDVSGSWTNDNVYLVTNDIVIPSGQTLNIQEGTQVKFDGYYSILVNGSLIANGTENSKITFSPNTYTDESDFWNNIIINSLETAPSTLYHCIFEHSKWDNAGYDKGVLHINGSATVSNNVINNSQATGIRVDSSDTVNILGNTITNCKYGVLVAGNGNILINENTISDINLIGIAANNQSTSTIIKRNIVHDCFPYGIQVTGDMNVTENIVYNITGNNACGIFVNGYQPTISNNTLFWNTDGIKLYSDVNTYNPNPIINSNIIANNYGYGIFSMGTPQPSLIAYNLFYNNTNGIGNHLPVGVGTIITTNNNGTDCDGFYNIFTDPMISSLDPSSSNFCHLSNGSTAINSGDPNILNPYNTTVIDIGARESDETLSINSFVSNNYFIYPNPVKDFVTIISKNVNTLKSITIYSINGAYLKKQNVNNALNEYKSDIFKGLKSGLYIVKINYNDNKTENFKLIKE